MRTLISSSKSLGGIYRAIVIERVEESMDTEEMVKNVRIYIPALHRTQMPFKLSADGSIEGCVFKTVSQSITNVSSPNSATDTEEMDEENDEEIEGDTNTTENETAEETSTTSETETEEDQDIVEDTTEDTSESLPPGLYMKKNDYPVAPISCWEVCPQLETGDQVWVIFENGDAEFPIVVGSLGAVLPSLSSFAATSTMSTGMSLDANDGFIELIISVIWSQEASGEITGLHTGLPETDPFTLGKVGFAKTKAVEVIKKSFEYMDDTQKEELDPGGELRNWVNNIAPNIDYNDNSTWWSANEKFRDRVDKVVTSEAGVKSQNECAKELVRGYVSKIMENGVTDPAVIIYVADILNQYGANYITSSQYSSNVKGKSLEDVHNWFSSNNPQYKTRRDNVYNKVKELDESGQLAQYQNYGSLSENRGGSMTVQQFLDMYNKVNGNYTDQPTQDFGGVSGTECPELPRYYLWVCFGIPKEKTEGIGNGNEIAINVCNWDVTKNHFYSVDKSAGVMPGDIVSLTSNTEKGRLYGHTGVVKTVESNGNFQIIDQWANAPNMAISSIEKSRLIAIARPK